MLAARALTDVVNAANDPPKKNRKPTKAGTERTRFSAIAIIIVAVAPNIKTHLLRPRS